MNNQGFIALAAVLIISAVFLSVAISVASRAISQLDGELAMYEREVARYRAEGCAEVALMELQRTLSFNGDESVSINGDQCEILLLAGTGDSHTIQTQSVAGSHTYYNEVITTAISPEMVLSSFRRIEH